MPTTRINGVPLKLDKMTDQEIWQLGQHINRNISQAERDMLRVADEMERRGILVDLPPAS